jgi:hypothetical protein
VPLPAFEMDGILFVFGAEGFQQITVYKQMLFQPDRDWPGVGFGTLLSELAFLPCSRSS